MGDGGESGQNIEERTSWGTAIVVDIFKDSL